MIQHQSPISGVAAFAGKFIATAGYDNQLVLWRADEHRSVARAWHDHLVNQTSFSSCGRFLVTASSDHTARLWAVPELKLLAVFSEHDDDVEMAVIHPTEPLVATASRDHCVRVFGFDGKLVWRLQGHTADVISVVWSKDGRHLVSSSDDGTIKRWALHDGTLIENIDLQGVETDTVAIAQDGTIFAGNDNGSLIVVRNGLPQTFEAHSAGIKRLVLNDETSRLVCISYDRTLSIWDVSAEVPALLRTSSLPSVVWPRSCAFVGQDTLVFATFGSTYATWDSTSDQWDVSRVGPTGGMNAVTVRGGRRYTIGDAGRLYQDGVVVQDIGSLCNFLLLVGPLMLTGGQIGQVFDAFTGRVLHQHRSPLNCGVAFPRDGGWYAVIGTYTGEGLVFEIDEDGACRMTRELTLHANAVKSLAVHGEQLFSVCADTSVAWLSTREFREMARMEGAHDRISNGCASLADGRFVSVGRDLRMRLWNIPGVPEVVATPHNRSIKCVGTSPDGRLVATGSYGGSVALYDVERKEWRPSQRPTTAGISSICFDSTRGCFVAASYDGRTYEVSA
ncbi:WD40 repeat protein [Paucibacter oligotrophus]|uniref:WD40 repeat protein n=1 Tax=Roseateles oligotrophus TaxID=1769250 RepID=A0A840L8X6_9BURK|nr:WD40 repeat domain-containing protein [Roseateles oligotrophus]MBB4843213.1 WD40 repeat protein [Roseateles oligotrophus]